MANKLSVQWVRVRAAPPNGIMPKPTFLSNVTTTTSPQTTLTPTTATLTSSTPASVTLKSLAVTPTTPGNLMVGATQQFTATGSYSNGSQQNLTSKVAWSSSNTNISSISSNGLATGLAPGNTGITASLSGITSNSIALNIITKRGQEEFFASTNYSGYFAASDLGTPDNGVTMVNGSWIVQNITPTEATSYSSQWTGIGGLPNYGDSSNLIQTGTASEYSGGTTHYYAFWETLPLQSNYHPLASESYPVNSW